MPSFQALPASTLFDPADSSEGSLDPLGLYPISDVLASRLGSPGVRERQRNLRFLTICTIGWEVIASVPTIEDPGDPTATLEQAFEWLVVEALTSGANEECDSLQGLPGATKAKACIEDGIHLNADRYLRMASVFGFYGVYRTLAEYLRLVARDSEQMPIIAEAGAGLLNVWRKEQRLPGFGRTLVGEGQKEYQALVRALTQSWKAGQAMPDRQADKFIQTYLWHNRPTAPLEAAELRRIVVDSGRDEADENRREMLQALAKPEAQKLFEEGKSDAEAKFHEWLLPQASERLKIALQAVGAYERFATGLQGLFEDLLFGISKKPGLIDLEEAAKTVGDLPKKAKELPKRYEETVSALQKVSGMAVRFERSFSRFGTPYQGVECLRQILEHHDAIQKAKPPKGKAPWLERSEARIAVRLRYQRHEPAARDGRYVYFYRSRPLFDLMKAVERPRGAA